MLMKEVVSPPLVYTLVISEIIYFLQCTWDPTMEGTFSTGNLNRLIVSCWFCTSWMF